MEFLTVEQVAKELNIDVQMVRYYIRKKSIRGVKHGRRYVVERGDLTKAMKRGF